MEASVAGEISASLTGEYSFKAGIKIMVSLLQPLICL
jgi:hypothetical protein